MRVWTERTDELPDYWLFEDDSEINWNFPMHGWVTIKPKDEPISIFNMSSVVAVTPDDVEPQ